jgi:hypothetical protein
MKTHDTNALASVVYRFFAGLDCRDHAGTAALVATDGSWHRQGTVLAGRAAVLAALEKRDPQRQTAHLITNLWVEHTTAETARVRFYLTAYETVTAVDGATGAPQMLGVRDCTDDLVLEDGEWRIACKNSRRFLPAE